MAVVFDAASSAWVNGTSNSLSLANITVGSGTNRALIAFLIFSQGTTPAGLTVTWDSGGTNQTMTAVTGAIVNDASNAATTVLYGLVNPTSGAKTLAVNWTTAVEGHVCCVSFTGVNQTGGATSFANGTGVDPQAVASGSITVNSSIGDQVVAEFTNNTWTFATVSGNLVAVQNIGPNLGSIASYSTAGSPSTTCTCSGGGTTWCPQVGCDVVAFVAAAPSGPVYLTGTGYVENYL